MIIDSIWIAIIIIVILIVALIFDYYEIKDLIEKSEELVESNEELSKLGLEATAQNKRLIDQMLEMEQILQLNRNLKKQMDKVISSKVAISKGKFEVTAYDLSVESCGKKPGDKGYGITANQTSLIGKDKDFNSVAVDTSIIPMDSIMYIDFIDKEDKVYSGVYTANDTGGAVKGKIIDMFIGDFGSTKEHISVPKFGRKKANVYILK